MRVLIRDDVGLYPETVLHFGEEIAFPVVAREFAGTAGAEVPDKVAARWKAARDQWHAVQLEAVAFAEAARKDARP
jgi:hypothetical protein